MPRSSTQRLTAALFCLGAVAVIATSSLATGQGIKTDSMRALEASVHRFAAAQDDPAGTLAGVLRDKREAKDAETLFWGHLLEARIRGLLEQPVAMDHALKAAEEQLRALPTASPLYGMAVRLQRLQLSTLTGNIDSLPEPVRRLAGETADAGSLRLSCEVKMLRAWVESETAMVDEAWRVAEQALACAKSLEDRELTASAYLQMGLLARGTSAGASARRTAYRYFRQAEDALGDRPARYLRSIIEWESGKTLGRDALLERERHFERARSLSDAIADEVGVAVASVDLAGIALQRRQFAKAVSLARAARRAYEQHTLMQRIPSTYAVTIAALAATNWEEAQREIDRAKSLDTERTATRESARLARTIGEAYAARQRYSEAYAELSRSVELEATARQEESSRLMLRLQATHEAAQREAENSSLLLRNESTRLQLEAARVRQERLMLAFGLALVVLLIGGFALVTVARERRSLAALAMRDELTGTPNRRSIRAIAEAQWDHCRRLKTPLLVAMIDLDHFKRVNDSYGHAVGDLVLQAFAQAASAALRAQDRIGRYGGEEWLLVAPGVLLEDVDALFSRIRSAFAAQVIPGLPRPHMLTFSMGAALDHERRTSLTSLIEEADDCMYEAKSGGRDRFHFRCVFQPIVDGISG
ncbi:MAG: GGDEF domain-containing protein [Rubrivivax sp.]|nr:GGDEF domain-containing protein [Rubrivivax sp.]